MGIANKVINILVLIAAIGAAVCAFLLWQKREQITKGREMLSEAIVQTVDKIGPRGQVQKDAMSIKLEADKLKEPISVLSKNIAKICKQRDEIAKAFADVVNNVNTLTSSLETKAQIEVAEMTSYDKYSGKRDEGVALVAERVNYYKQRSEIIKNGLKELSAAMELSGLSEEAFWDNTKLGADLAEQVKRAAELTARFHKYSDHILSATDRLQDAVSEENIQLKKPALGIENDVWRDDLSGNMEGVHAVAEKITALRETVAKLKKENETLKKQLSEKDAIIKKKDGEIASLSKELTDAKAEIKRLKKIIDPSSDGEDSGSDSAAQQADFSVVKKLVGKITYVNPQYGFVMIDLGAKSTVKGLGVDGKQLIDKPAPLPQNAIMTVATSLNPEDAKYVARISVARIGATSSIANVLPLPGSAEPKVGDTVFFSDSDIRQMAAIRELALKQAEEAAAREKAKEAEAAILAGEKTGDDESAEETDDEEEGEEKKTSSDDDSSSEGSEAEEEE